jgi:tRNA(Ile)-lysidine synthase
MASSRTSRRNSTIDPALVSHVAGQLSDVVKRGDRLVVGLSGGLDSVALLDVLIRIAGRRRFQLGALHINHQISRNAARWEAFCRAICDSHDIALRVIRIKVPRGDSLEAAARAARYDAFRSQPAEYVVVAHNQDDQAETLLLQLLRGAGVKGLAAMPAIRREAARGSRLTRHPAPSILRPLLDVPRARIEAYARLRKLEWIEDESNSDTYYPRNFLRHEVLPVISRRFPSYRTTLARAARNLAEAAQLLDDLAVHDGAGYLGEASLQITGLRTRSRIRAKNLLRYFLALRGAVMPNAERLDEALRQSLNAKDDAQVCIDLGDCELRRFAGALHVVGKQPGVSADFARAWRGERELALPELNGVLRMDQARGAGISRAKLQSRPVTIRVRSGGERLQPDRARPRRSVKNLLQEFCVPPWLRDRLPFIYCGEQLVWIPGIGIDCGFQGQAGEPSVVPVWRAR